jgi:prolipoprotein diacylglyceryltransferase
VRTVPVVDITPYPIASSIGTLPIHWYGITCAMDLAAIFLVLSHAARWRGLDVRLLPNARSGVPSPPLP